ncbi:hypothetical protein AB0N05_14915 [Nocardia sp. NPDC051030]|uniref:hypothetical protein n=1 Tax=Nocardia sp. NPDC051030 TaxID=3155162 RepID=UPI00343A06B2
MSGAQRLERARIAHGHRLAERTHSRARSGYFRRGGPTEVAPHALVGAGTLMYCDTLTSASSPATFEDAVHR